MGLDASALEAATHGATAVMSERCEPGRGRVGISATARWVAYARALESDRPDALFRDPFARRLAGAEGASRWQQGFELGMIARALAVRTAVMDEMIIERLREDNVDLVLNLAAGLDTRAWRLPLPSTMRWIDVDGPELQEYKRSVMANERTACQYESLHADLNVPAQRDQVLARCAAAHRALVVTEGWLVYLRAPQVTALAHALRGEKAVRSWLTDLAGPKALELLQRVWGPLLGGARFEFAPADSVEFFARSGWREQTFRSSQQEARRLNRATRLPLLARFAQFMAPAAVREEQRRLSGCALLVRSDVTA